MSLSSTQRSHIWQCIKDDNVHQLMLALKLYKVHDLDTLRTLDTQLWRNGKGKGGWLAFGLMDVCAINLQNVPEESGALQCLSALLDKYSTLGFSSSVEHILYKCEMLNRFKAKELVQSYIQV